MRQERRIGRHHDDDRAVAIRRRAAAAHALRARDLAADRHAGNRQALARPVVGLHQHATRSSRRPRRLAVPMPPLNPCATIPVPPPTLPSATGAGRARVQRLERVRLGDVLAEAVVEERIGRLADDRLVPWNLPLQHFGKPTVDRIADHADRIRAGDHHRSAEHAALDHPRRAGHLAEAVAREPPGEHRLPTSCPWAGSPSRRCGPVPCRRPAARCPR